MTKQPKFEDMTPLGDRVIVKPHTQDEKSASGIIILQTNDDNTPSSGVIVALGEGGTFKDCPVPTGFLKVGDNVWFNKYAGEELEITDEKTHAKETFVILRLDAVYGFSKRK